MAGAACDSRPSRLGDELRDDPRPSRLEREDSSGFCPPSIKASRAGLTPPAGVEGVLPTAPLTLGWEGISSLRTGVMLAELAGPVGVSRASLGRLVSGSRAKERLSPAEDLGI